MFRNRYVLLILAALAWVCPVRADDEASVETEALEIADTLHCMVCSDPNIEAAKDEVAKDLRLFIRKHLTDGKPQELVVNLVLSNYGEIVTLEAPSPDRSDGNERLFVSVLSFVLSFAVLLYIFRRSKTFRSSASGGGAP